MGAWDELLYCTEIKMKEAEAHYKNGWITVQGADAVIADK